MWGERGYIDGCTVCTFTQQYHFASMAAQLSSKGIPHYNLLTSPQAFSPQSQQPLPWDWFPVPTPQFPTTMCSRGLGSLSRECSVAARIVCVVLTPFRLSQISCCTQRLLLCPKQLLWCGDLIPALVPPPFVCRSSPIHSPLFPFLPSSFWDLCGFVYSFLVVRDSCLLSAGVVWDLLHLKVCSWCICGERCTPHPPTPLPSFWNFQPSFVTNWIKYFFLIPSH